MTNRFLKRSMTYLGLVDDEYDEDEVPISHDVLGSSRSSDGAAYEDEIPPARAVRAVNPVEREESPTVSLITPRLRRAKSTALSAHVLAIAPTEFADAREIADRVMAGQPVIVNLQSASRELKRRMIDFSSGVTCALGGGMERVASGVFLITPSDVELSADERRRA